MAKEENRGKKLICYGYSLGATMSFGTLGFLKTTDSDFYSNFEAMIAVSPQCGLGRIWYPRWWRPRPGKLLMKLFPNYQSFPPFVSMRDRHDPLAYKGAVYAKFIWEIEKWTKHNLDIEAPKLTLPLHFTMSAKDSTCSPDAQR